MKGDNRVAFAEFEQQLLAECGDGCHKRCLGLLFSFLGGLRMTLPDLDEMYRRSRNEQIRNQFTGANYEELAIRYRLTVRQVRSVLTR